MDGETTRMAYIARCKCGGLVFASVDEPDRARENAKEISRMIKDGYTIDRMTCDEVRKVDWCKNMGDCK